ncbi:hypothetical protein GGU45_003814 [Niabella hirudinis]
MLVDLHIMSRSNDTCPLQITENYFGGFENYKKKDASNIINKFMAVKTQYP